jgi:hypothetical protein
MRHHHRFANESGRATFVAFLFVALAAASCSTSDSIGALHDGARADGKSGTGGNGTGGATGGAIGTGGAQGTGGRLGSGGGIGSGGALGTGGLFVTGGRIGTGGVIGTGGRAGTGGVTGSGGSVDAALDAHVCVITDVYCPYGYVLDAYGCSVCAPGGSGGSGSGGSSGKGGAGGTLDVAQDGVVACGSTTCAVGEYCCNAACNLCAPMGYSCIQECGMDAGQDVDSNGCKAIPSNDSLRCGGSRPPHYYACEMTMLAAPCTILSIGDIVNTFCCP